MIDSKHNSHIVVEDQNLQRQQPVLGLLADIDHFAVHDGPGIRTAVYLKGCPLHCVWCHSPETQSFSPELLYLPQKCSACGLCLNVCAQDALSPVDEPSPSREARIAAWRWIGNAARTAQPARHVCYPGALKMSGTWMTAAELVGTGGERPALLRRVGRRGDIDRRRGHGAARLLRASSWPAAAPWGSIPRWRPTAALPGRCTRICWRWSIFSCTTSNIWTIPATAG